MEDIEIFERMGLALAIGAGVVSNGICVKGRRGGSRCRTVLYCKNAAVHAELLHLT